MTQPSLKDNSRRVKTFFKVRKLNIVKRQTEKYITF